MSKELKSRTPEEIAEAKRAANRRWYEKKKAEAEAKAASADTSSYTEEESSAKNGTYTKEALLQKIASYEKIIESLNYRLRTLERNHNALKVAVMQHNTYALDALKHAYSSIGMSKDLLENAPIMKDTTGGTV